MAVHGLGVQPEEERWLHARLRSGGGDSPYPPLTTVVLSVIRFSAAKIRCSGRGVPAGPDGDTLTGRPARLMRPCDGPCVHT